jgi:Glycosyltransferase
MRKFAVNGRFVVRKLTGQERFARELLAELDKLVLPGDIEMVVPIYARKESIPVYQNIKIVRYGNIKSLFWEQIDFLYYIIKNKRYALNLCTTCPILNPGLNTIHDINQNVNPNYFKNFYGRLSTIWHKIMLNSTLLLGKKMLTVSEFSKKEMLTHLKVRPNFITVIGNGWQHINRIIPDMGIFDRFPNLKENQYYFAASSLTPQKNFRWIIEVSKRNSNFLFAIAGNKMGLTNFNVENTPNLCFLGYVTDEEMKALMMNCKAFIHPAKYEGFGIPPLEALANGADVIVARSSCLPEIFEDCVHYIDPENSNVDLEVLLKEPVADRNKVLDKYSWSIMAHKLYDVLISI